MVAKKGTTTKKMKDLGARKVRATQAGKVKGGISATGGGSGSGEVGCIKVRRALAKDPGERWEAGRLGPTGR